MAPAFDGRPGDPGLVARRVTAVGLDRLPDRWQVRHGVGFASGLDDVDDHVVDHVVVGPGGIFVVDSTSARAHGSAEAVQDAADRVAAASRAVRRLLRWEDLGRGGGEPGATPRWSADVPVVPVLSLVGGDVSAPGEVVVGHDRAGGPRGVLVLSPSALREHLLAQPEVLRPAEVAMVTWAVNRAARSVPDTAPDGERRGLVRTALLALTAAAGAAALVGLVAGALVAVPHVVGATAASGTTDPAAAAPAPGPVSDPRGGQTQDPAETLTRAWGQVTTVVASTADEGAEPETLTASMARPEAVAGGRGGGTRLLTTAVEVRNTGTDALDLGELDWSLTGRAGGETVTARLVDGAVAGDRLSEQAPLQPGAVRSDLLVWRVGAGFEPDAGSLQVLGATTLWRAASGD